MQIRRILVGMVALLIFCGPMCVLPLAAASASKEDCHSTPAPEEQQPVIHFCCQSAVTPSAMALSPELPVANQSPSLFQMSLPQEGNLFASPVNYSYPSISLAFAILRI
jgi:hypothetical protein